MKQFTENPPATQPQQANGSPGVVNHDLAKKGGDGHEPPEVRAAKYLGSRYRLPFIDLLPVDEESPIDYEIFNQIPVDLMVRYQFLPLRRDEKGMHVALADPTDLERIDEISGALRSRIVPYVATAGSIELVLR